MYSCRLYDGWKPLCFHHATRVSHGPGGNLSRAPLPVVSTDPRGWYKRLQGRHFCGILTENAGKLFNYATSFAVTQSQMTPNPREAYVTLNVLQNWFQNFQRRLQQNPYFWRG